KNRHTDDDRTTAYSEIRAAMETLKKRGATFTGVVMISITGQALTLDDVQRVALGHERDLVLSPEAREKVSRSRRFVEELLQENERIYGVTTGFGRLSEVFIQPVRRKELQRNLIRSHASGVGQPLSPPEARTVTLPRASSPAGGD